MSLESENTELRAEIKRLEECARHQARGPKGAKTLRVEFVANEDDPTRFHLVVTFPSSIRGGDKLAAETIGNVMNLVMKTARFVP